MANYVGEPRWKIVSFDLTHHSSRQPILGEYLPEKPSFATEQTQSSKHCYGNTQTADACSVSTAVFSGLSEDDEVISKNLKRNGISSTRVGSGSINSLKNKYAFPKSSSQQNEASVSVIKERSRYSGFTVVE
ncbi:hypothetical protein C8R42DRAFT_640726 [Lentinula raphanica]|nr:hypothetical protein C8R42DRAFT_640726 [Lentinula raphanica]